LYSGEDQDQENQKFRTLKIEDLKCLAFLYKLNLFQ